MIFLFGMFRKFFNSIILHQTEWIKLLESENQDYPEHEKIISKLSKYEITPLSLIDKIIFEVENSKL